MRILHIGICALGLAVCASCSTLAHGQAATITRDAPLTHEEGKNMTKLKTMDAPAAAAVSLEGKPAVTLEAGEVLFIPAGTIHAVKNVGSGNAAELATYIVEKGKPLLVPAK